MKRFVLIVLASMITFLLEAQQSACFNSLIEASKSYNKGELSDVIKRITPCLRNNNYDRYEAAQAYRLLALTYLALNQFSRADSCTKKLLMKNHNYQKFPNLEDDIEFSRLVNSYQIVPKLFLGGKIGLNFTQVTHVVNYSVSDTRSVYTLQTNFYGGFLIEYAISPSINAGMDMLYSILSYQHQLDNVAGWKQVFHEDLSYVSIPVFVRYQWIMKHIKPYAELGGEFSFLQSVKANIQATDNTYGTTTNTAVNPMNRRNKNDQGILGGIGLSVKTGDLIFFGSMRYVLGLKEVVNASRRYDDVSVMLKNQYADDDFKLSNIQLSLGFKAPVLYKVNKSSNDY